jgi:hypothetical protein
MIKHPTALPHANAAAADHDVILTSTRSITQKFSKAIGMEIDAAGAAHWRPTKM